MVLYARLSNNIIQDHLWNRKNCAFPWTLMTTSISSHTAITGHGGKRYKLSKIRPSSKSNIARWKPHNGQLIPKSCLYAQGSSKNTFHSD